MHKAGEWMVSYRFMHMDMGGNRIGTDDVSPQEIVTTIPNIFFGMPGQPPTLRVVPTDMGMDMHMFGLMYAPADWLTLMAMGNFVSKKMNHITFQGGMGTTELGTFETRSSGLGDTSLTGLLRLFDDGNNHVHLNAGLSVPTGSITKSDQVLTPMGMTPTVRLPYAMQLGSGTVDLNPGITYTGESGSLAWGAQYVGTLRLGENSQGYSFGNQHNVTAWGSYLWDDWISTSFRLAGQMQGKIDGQDPNIVAPVQTANPDFYGGKRIDALIGINLAGQEGFLRNKRLAIEVGAPIYQDLNGPQMETDWTVTLGVQAAF